MVADGLLSVLSRSELAAVIAHEVAHNVEVSDDRLLLRIIEAITATFRWLSGALSFSVATLYVGWRLGWWAMPIELMPLACVIAVAVIFGLFLGARLHDLVLQECEVMADVCGSEKIGSVLPLIDALTKITHPAKEKTWKDIILYKPRQKTHPSLDRRVRKLFSIRKYAIC